MLTCKSDVHVIFKVEKHASGVVRRVAEVLRQAKSNMAKKAFVKNESMLKAVLELVKVGEILQQDTFDRMGGSYTQISGR